MGSTSSSFRLGTPGRASRGGGAIPAAAGAPPPSTHIHDLRLEIDGDLPAKGDSTDLRSTRMGRYAKFPSLVDSARGFMLPVTGLAGALLVATAGALWIGLAWDLRLFLPLLMAACSYAITAFALTCCGCAAVVVRSPRALLAFSGVAYTLTFACSALSTLSACIALATVSSAGVHGLAPGMVSSAALVFAVACATFAAQWALSAEDARQTRSTLLWGDVPAPGSSSIYSATSALHAHASQAKPGPVSSTTPHAVHLQTQRRDEPGPGAASKSPPTGRGSSRALFLQVLFPPPQEPASSSPAPVAEEGGDSTGEAGHGPGQEILDAAEQTRHDAASERVLWRTHIPCILSTAAPAVLVACGLLLQFASSPLPPAMSVEVLIVSARAEAGDAYMAYEGALAAIQGDEDRRPVARVLTVPESAPVASHRGVPMVQAMARWRRVGVLKGPTEAPRQLIMVIGSTSRDDSEAGPLDGSQTLAAGRDAASCLRALLSMERAGSTSRWHALGFTEARLAAAVREKSQGIQPPDSPRRASFDSFAVQCYDSAVFDAEWWEGAEAALGPQRLHNDGCASTAGLVGGMGPVAGAAFVQVVVAYLRGDASSELAQRGVCVEVYSNPQLEANSAQVLHSAAAAERQLLSIRDFLRRRDLTTFSGASNTWYQISFRLMVWRAL